MYHEKSKPQRIGFYQFHDTVLGKGNFACVYKAHHKLVGCDVALKVINVDNIKEDYVYRNLTREARILRGLRHPNIIRLYETVESENLYCLSLELVRGTNLSQFMKKQENNKISEKLARVFFYQMLTAVEYMHRSNYIHRDLKQENVLVEFGHVIKIVDFGLSNVYYPCYQLRTHCGSAEYAAPELFRSHSPYGTPTDLWSLGVILYAMVIGSLPFNMKTDPSNPSKAALYRERFIRRISKGLMQENWEKMEGLSSECWDLLHDLLQPDQFRRIHIGPALIHHWITKDTFLKKRLPQRRRDLHRKFEKEIAEFLSDKLNIPKTRIDRHLHTRHTLQVNSKTTVLFYIVRDTLIKDILYPPKNIETSFLYRFEFWRQNRSALSEELGKVFDDKNISNYARSNENKNSYNTKQAITLGKIDADKNCLTPIEYMKIERTDCHSSAEDENSSHVVKLLRSDQKEPGKVETFDVRISTPQTESRIPYRSYKQSRPEKVKNYTSKVKVLTNASRKSNKSVRTLQKSNSDSVDTQHNVETEESSVAKKISKFEKLSMKTTDEETKAEQGTSNLQMSRKDSVLKLEIKPFTVPIQSHSNLKNPDDSENEDISPNGRSHVLENRISIKANHQVRTGQINQTPTDFFEYHSRNLHQIEKKIMRHRHNSVERKLRERIETSAYKRKLSSETTKANIKAYISETPKKVTEFQNEFSDKRTLNLRKLDEVKNSPIIRRRNDITILKSKPPQDTSNIRRDSNISPVISSRIPIKNIRYGPPAAFSQPVMKSKRTTVAERMSRNGDINEN